MSLLAQLRDISTHILTKRMTSPFFPNATHEIISTHILTKRMTMSFLPFAAIRIISTHILTKRMTMTTMSSNRPQSHFNSHPHEEDDQFRICLTPCCIDISTHILTKRMTTLESSRDPAEPFQLTSSRRGWPCLPSLRSLYLLHFNSHPHEEDDFAACPHSLMCWVFQLTSSRRGWPVLAFEIYWQFHFNSHPHEEDDRFVNHRLSTCCNFNSHPHEEDDNKTSLEVEEWLFQLTSSRRGWRKYIIYIDCNSYFNSHPHEEDDIH